LTKNKLRIATWNCNGALRKKWGQLAALKADVYVVQECEDPSQTNDAAYNSWCANHLWTGTNKNKGIGIFATSERTLQAVPLDLAPLELFLPCLVDGAWPLLATWTKHVK
jgi:exonuclease III